jgi:hypothetical protein
MNSFGETILGLAVEALSAGRGANSNLPASRSEEKNPLTAQSCYIWMVALRATVLVLGRGSPSRNTICV